MNVRKELYENIFFTSHKDNVFIKHFFMKSITLYFSFYFLSAYNTQRAHDILYFYITTYNNIFSPPRCHIFIQNSFLRHFILYT